MGSMPIFATCFRITIVCSALLVGGVLSCTSTRTSRKSDQPGFDYSHYRTYAIVETVPLSSENPAFQWPQLTSRIRSELNFFLPSVGLDPVQQNPDLRMYVYVIADPDEGPPVLTYQIGWRAEPFLAAGERFDAYASNTLVLDIVDPRLNELVWRGSTRLPLNSEPETYKVLGTRLKKLVQRYPKTPSQN